MSLTGLESSAVTTIQKKGSYYDVYEGSHYIGPYSTFALAWTKAETYLAGARDYQDDIRLKGDITVASQITVPEYTMVRGPAKLSQGFNGTLFTDEQIGSDLNADEITMRDLNIVMDSTTYDASGTAIHMCPRDGSFENLKIWDALDEAVIFESRGHALSERVLALSLNNIWIGRHFLLGSKAGGLYFKEDWTGAGASDVHMNDMYLINSYNYQIKMEYGANYHIDQMHLTGFGTGSTVGMICDHAYEVYWNGGTVESCRADGVVIEDGSYLVNLSNILFTDNGNYTDDTFSDVLVDSSVGTSRGVNVNRCHFRDSGGQANNPKYNVYFKGANSDYCFARENYFDTDYAITATTLDESGTALIENNTTYAS